MTQIWERLYIGGFTDAERLTKGNPNHIDTVISLCEECVTSKRRGVNYVHIPIEDDQPIPVGKFDAVIDAIAENIRWGTVLLHCRVGLSRAPSLAAAYLHVVGYRNIDAAIEEIRAMRPIINPSKVLLCSVKENLR
jgi:protein-tyrosine phosphatase